MKVFLILLLSIFFCSQCIYLPFSNCDQEKKKRDECRIRNLALCEISPEAEKYRKSGIDICTNLDGYFFLLWGTCDAHLSESCKPSSSSSRSN
ncbi:MAG: hypothetical protein KDK36_02030 [Leptospiraceae bacterium]|nr:hypothetical protein [Leptospiraceae bacterium]